MSVSNLSTGMRPGVCLSSSRPTTPYTGQTIFETDTNKLLVWNATSWVIPNSPAQNPQALELITTCTVTSVGGTSATASGGVVTIGTSNTSVTVSGAFSSTYDNYKIIVSGGTSSAQVALKFELGGSAGSYYGTYIYATYATATPLSATINAQASMIYAGGADLNVLNMNLELQNPFLAKITNIQALMVGWGNNRGTAVCDHEVASSFTSFRIFPDSGNISSGQIRVYGYRNS
jgi:hypothetical protein